MPLPKPHAAQIPSLHDGVPIDCRIYAADSPTHDASQIAIVAHPYGPLGGSYDDRVVLLAVEALTGAGRAVATFNFRTRPSWTLGMEVRDYASVAMLMLGFSNARLAATGSARSRASTRLILGGYSYGSLVAWHVRPGMDIIQQDACTSTGARILGIAGGLAAGMARGSVVAAELVPASLRDVVVTTDYLLISPLLGLVRLFLAPAAACTSSGGQDHPLQGNKALAIFGTDDGFTSSRRVESWAVARGVQAMVIKGGTHFWHGWGHAEALTEAIASWAR